MRTFVDMFKVYLLMSSFAWGVELKVSFLYAKNNFIFSFQEIFFVK